MSGGDLNHFLNLRGTVNYNGTLVSATSSTVDYARNNPQSVFASGTYANFTISGTGTKTLSGDVTASGVVNMSGGNINCAGNDLILTNAAVGALTRSSGTLIGKLRRAINTIGSYYLYPVGTSGSYNPFEIRFGDLGAGSLQVEYMAADIGSAGLPVTDNGVSVYDRYTTGYWTLEAFDGITSGNFDVNLNCNGFTGVNTGSRILQRINGGNLQSNGIHGSFAGSVISRTGLNNISGGIIDLAVCKGHPHIVT